MRPMAARMNMSFVAQTHEYMRLPSYAWSGLSVAMWLACVGDAEGERRSSLCRDGVEGFEESQIIAASSALTCRSEMTLCGERLSLI